MPKRLSAPSLAICGMLAALVTVATMVFTIPTPGTGGYVHIGDALILFSAMLVGPMAALIGGIGSALADLLGGYGAYVLPTLCIKGLVGFLASRRIQIEGQHALLRCALTFGVAELVMVIGYAAYETATFGFAAALASVPMNLVQAVFSAAIGCALLPIARRIAPRVRGGGRPL